MTSTSTFVFGVILLSCITRVSADGLGIGYGSLYMQHDVKDVTEMPKLEEMKEPLIQEYVYELTAVDMDQLHACFDFKYFRYWNGNNDTSMLTEQEAFCQRLIDDKPTISEATEYKTSHRFEAMFTAFKQFSPQKPIYPTKDEMLEMEECFFSRSAHEENKKNVSLLSLSEAFCTRLQRDIHNQSEILMDGSFYPFGPFLNYWHDLTIVARKDFAQVVQCSPKMYSQRFSGPCKGFYNLITKSQTVRDFRRKHLDMCMRMQRLKKHTAESKAKCLQIVRQYKRLYCDFKGY